MIMKTPGVMILKSHTQGPQTVPRSSSNASMLCPSTPGTPRFFLTSFQALKTSRFGISCDLVSVTCSSHCWLTHPKNLNRTAPSLHSHSKSFFTTTGSSAPASRIGTQILAPFHGLGSLPYHHETGSHVPHSSPNRSHAASMPDALWPFSTPTPQ